MPLKAISAEKLYYKPFKPSHSLVEGIISRGLTVLAGTSKIGKSWMMLDLAISVASGSSFLGRKTRGCITLGMNMGFKGFSKESARTVLRMFIKDRTSI